MKVYSILRWIVTVIVLLTVHDTIYAADIKGHIYDQNPKEQLIGATVTLHPSLRKISSSLDGGFILRTL